MNVASVQRVDAQHNRHSESIFSGSCDRLPDCRQGFHVMSNKALLEVQRGSFIGASVAVQGEPVRRYVAWLPTLNGCLRVGP
jgi:hypothetical protein